MNDHLPEPFSFRPSVPTNLPTTSMAQSDDQAKQLPRPALLRPQGRHTAPDYDQFVRKFHQHNLSDSTATSNDSSPTTTISTVDDSSATEPSPGSSPESPPPTTFTVGMLRPRTADDRSRPFFELQKQPPPKKGRNLKNLAVVTSRQPGRAASTTSLPLETQPKGESILSPSFVKPPTPPRRKPSNLGLTIMTPGGSRPPPREVRLTIPPTPGFSRPGTLRHFQSSPSLPLVSGIGLPHYTGSHDRSKQGLLDTIFSPIEREASPQIAEVAEDEEEQNFDIPLSREEKPEAYPDGPICVYDPHIDLYLEPTAAQARQYDVVMNVASEVRNPFVKGPEEAAAEPDLRLDGGGGIQYAPKRTNLKAVSGTSNGSNGERQTVSVNSEESGPTGHSFETSSHGRPEYIHIPWEHNSDIVPDLLRLVKLIDDKVMEGKRVLIHCQCGVSRSASLVVAYGLYKDPSISVQEAYDAVKKKSKWIGPNMNLIMQLQEFRSSLARGGILSENRALSPLTPSSAASEWRSPFSIHSPPLGLHDPLLSAAPAPSPRQGTTESNAAVSPGPSSAPSGLAWPLRENKRERTSGAPKPAQAYVDPSGHVVPVLTVVADSSYKHEPIHSAVPEAKRQSNSLEPSLSSPRSAEFAMGPLKPSLDVDSADDFGLMSPTSTEFTSSPFDRSALLASLGMGSMRADEETPRRSLSLRNRDSAEQRQTAGHDQQRSGGHPPQRPLRGKISSPTLREQKQLQEMQSRMEATLSKRNSPPAQSSPTMDDALMSPRATEFTNNPFALPMPTSDSQVSTETLRETMADPRSPAHKGASPIIRSILDVL